MRIGAIGKVPKPLAGSSSLSGGAILSNKDKWLRVRVRSHFSSLANSYHASYCPAFFPSILGHPRAKSAHFRRRGKARGTFSGPPLESFADRYKITSDESARRGRTLPPVALPPETRFRERAFLRVALFPHFDPRGWGPLPAAVPLPPSTSDRSHPPGRAPPGSERSKASRGTRRGRDGAEARGALTPRRLRDLTVANRRVPAPSLPRKRGAPQGRNLRTAGARTRGGNVEGALPRRTPQVLKITSRRKPDRRRSIPSRASRCRSRSSCGRRRNLRT